jgi:hypothetical protein
MATADKEGRPYARLVDLNPGDKIQVDSDFDCMEPWSIKEVYRDSKTGELSIQCNEGGHVLDGQDFGDGYLVGIYHHA